MGGGPGGQFDLRSAEKRLRGNGIVNKVLQQICQHEGLEKNGVKSAMQTRILESKFGGGSRHSLAHMFLASRLYFHFHLSSLLYILILYFEADISCSIRTEEPRKQRRFSSLQPT